ncbi:hypothetical protein JCM19992_17060 [Thermostilla marina]
MTAKACEIVEDLPTLPARARDAHKGNFGLVFVVGGSVGMAGAPALAAMGALRSGAGLVRVAVPHPCWAITASFDPSYMCLPLPADRNGRLALDARSAIMEASSSASWLVVGPGLGRSAALDRITADLYKEIDRPLVVDADGLNALAGNEHVLAAPGGPRVLTPHPGEFARLLGKRLPSREEQVRAAEELARRWQCVLVLKGHGTAVTDGMRTYVNRTGNPGMAVGGSGDVLSGCIAALGAAGLSPFHAASLGVFLHGSAGDLAAARLGEDGMTAVDLCCDLPRAIKLYRESRGTGSRGTRQREF